jgi:hypothetical protein
MSLFKNASALVAVLALVACETEQPANTLAADLGVDQAPPPGAGGLTLSIDGALIPGNTIVIRITGAQPNQNVYFARGTAYAAGSLCPGALNGLCIDMTGTTLMSTTPADAQGRVQFSVTVPNLPDGRVVYFQAATGGATAATSNVIAKFNLLPAGNPNRTYGIIVVEDGTVVPGTSYDALRSEIYFSNALLLDTCIIDLPGTATGLGALPACASCAWAFDVRYPTGRDASESGDCIDIFGFDPATIAPFSIGRGYAPSYYIAGYGTYETVFAFDTTAASWEAYVFSATPGSIFDPATGAFNWGVDFGEYIPY